MWKVRKRTSHFKLILGAVANIYSSAHVSCENVRAKSFNSWAQVQKKMLHKTLKGSETAFVFLRDSRNSFSEQLEVIIIPPTKEIQFWKSFLIILPPTYPTLRKKSSRVVRQIHFWQFSLALKVLAQPPPSACSISFQLFPSTSMATKGDTGHWSILTKKDLLFPTKKQVHWSIYFYGEKRKLNLGDFKS